MAESNVQALCTKYAEELERLERVDNVQSILMRNKNHPFGSAVITCSRNQIIIHGDWSPNGGIASTRSMTFNDFARFGAVDHLCEKFSVPKILHKSDVIVYIKELDDIDDERKRDLLDDVEDLDITVDCEASSTLLGEILYRNLYDHYPDYPLEYHKDTAAQLFAIQQRFRELYFDFAGAESGQR